MTNITRKPTTENRETRLSKAIEKYCERGPALVVELEDQVAALQAELAELKAKRPKRNSNRGSELVELLRAV